MTARSNESRKSSATPEESKYYHKHFTKKKQNGTEME